MPSRSVPATDAAFTRLVHVTPSGDVITVPSSPTATYRLVAKATAERLRPWITLVGTVVADQVLPSGDVTTVPPLPTATQPFVPNAVPKRASVVPEMTGAQLVPFGDMNMVPKIPTATNSLDP